MKFAVRTALAACLVLVLSTAGTGCSITASQRSSLPAGVGWNGRGPMSEYDKEVIRAIQAKWFSLLEEVKESLGAGMVRIGFLLQADGAIEPPSILASTSHPQGVELAVRAVSEAAPFGAWPEKLVRRTGGTSREIEITFYYQ